MFESHITVSIPRDQFLKTCQTNHLTPLVIVQDTGTSNPTQMMTKRFHATHDQQVALQEMHSIADQFTNVIRRKLELICGKQPDSSEYLYEEFHAKYEVPGDLVEHFDLIVAKVGGHVSQNALKTHKFRFCTARNQNTFDTLLKRLSPFKRVSAIHERVVYDDNRGLDDRWQDCFDCPMMAHKRYQTNN